MISVAGIFPRRAVAESSIDRLLSIGIPDERLALLSPGVADEEVEEVMPKVETDDRGTGEKIGSAVGRGIGIAGGIMLGGAVGSVFVPGVGADMKSNGRAREFGETEGFIKVVVDAETDRILGAAVLATEGAELVHIYVDLMKADAPYTVIRDAIHIHPTLVEAVQSVLTSFGRCLTFFK
jgi:Pyridine nucleotide-disulphide oxidoreductase, dimerisation domain